MSLSLCFVDCYIQEETFVLTQYLGLFARIAIYDPAFFIGFIEIASQQCDPPQPNLMSLVLETWFDKVKFLINYCFL